MCSGLAWPLLPYCLFALFRLWGDSRAPFLQLLWKRRVNAFVCYLRSGEYEFSAIEQTCPRPNQDCNICDGCTERSGSGQQVQPQEVSAKCVQKSGRSLGIPRPKAPVRIYIVSTSAGKIARFGGPSSLHQRKISSKKKETTLYRSQRNNNNNQVKGKWNYQRLRKHFEGATNQEAWVEKRLLG